MFYLHDICFEQTISFDDFVFQSSGFFNINVTFLIGSKGNGDYFSFEITNDMSSDSKIKIYEDIDVYYIKKGELAMDTFNKHIILELINKVVNEVNLTESYNIIDKDHVLRKYFNWEFDNYQEM